MSLALLRSAALWLPLLMAVGMWSWRRPDPRQRTAVLVATCYNGAALLFLQLLAVPRWWSWSPELQGGLVLGMPAEVWIGWSVLWGFLPLVTTRLLVAVPAALLVDLHLMPRLAPMLRLEEGWLIGEALAIALALVPGLLLARATLTRAATGLRAAGQVLWFHAVVLGLLPAAIGASVQLPLWQLGVLPLAWFCAAALAFVEDGDGTPIPLDPPQRLVTTGPYAYVRNPMQLSAALTFGLLGATTLEPVLACGAIVVVVYSIGFARWHEDAVLQRLEGWSDYRSQVRAWLPRWRPFAGERATLFYAPGCDLCSDLAGRIARLAPVGLDFIEATRHPEPLRRVRWERPGCPPADGVIALCRALEQVNLGFAAVAVVGRLPVVRTVLQLVIDALGGAPRVLADVEAK